jgi:hypothetical protein
MSEPKKIQVIRSHQNLNEYIYQSNANFQENSYEQILLDRKDYHALGWRRLHILQTLPLKENWPITIGNAIAAFSSGFLGLFFLFKFIHSLNKFTFTVIEI